MKVKVVTKKYRLSAQTGQDRINVSTRSGIVMARKLSDLQDVDVSGVKDQFVLMYDQSENKYKAVNPDEVLISSALTETTQPGLPQQFIEYLNTILNLDDQDLADLADRINNLTLGDLKDVEVDDALDKYIIMFNQALNEWQAQNPDSLLTAAVEETTNPGLPDAFLDQLDEDLDNRIDIDAGEY